MLKNFDEEFSIDEVVEGSSSADKGLSPFTNTELDLSIKSIAHAEVPFEIFSCNFSLSDKF